MGYFTYNGITFTLNDDLVWESSEPGAEVFFNDCYNAGEPPYCSPAAGQPGRLAIVDAAKAFGAEPTMGPEEPGEPDAVY